MNEGHVLVISGMSGAGKSSALRVFEDLGYYCIDNLPPPLLRTFIDLCGRAGTGLDKIAVAIDARSGEFLKQFEAMWEELRQSDPGARLIFFDATDEALQHRFSETRRPHPLAPEGPVESGVGAEREILAAIRSYADHVIDTSEFNVWALREFLGQRFGGKADAGPRITLASFGFRHGLLQNADLVFDVRFLPNPYYSAELRSLTGLDAPVREFVESQPATREFLDHVDRLLGFLLPEYAAEGKTYLTVAFGCTGGRHRSVAMVGMVNAMLTEKGYTTTVSHADIEGSDSRRFAR